MQANETKTATIKLAETAETYQANRWQVPGKDRLYIKRATGFKNRPWQSVGYWDFETQTWEDERPFNYGHRPDRLAVLLAPFGVEVRK